MGKGPFKLKTSSFKDGTVEGTSAYKKLSDVQAAAIAAARSDSPIKPVELDYGGGFDPNISYEATEATPKDTADKEELEKWRETGGKDEEGFTYFILDYLFLHNFRRRYCH